MAVENQRKIVSNLSKISIKMNGLQVLENVNGLTDKINGIKRRKVEIDTKPQR